MPRDLLTHLSFVERLMPAEPTNKTILIIDDDREIAAMLMGVLQSNGHRVVHAPNGVEGQRQIEAIKPDLVITDMMMPSNTKNQTTNVHKFGLSRTACASSNV